MSQILFCNGLDPPGKSKCNGTESKPFGTVNEIGRKDPCRTKMDETLIDEKNRLPLENEKIKNENYWLNFEISEEKNWKVIND